MCELDERAKVSMLSERDHGFFLKKDKRNILLPIKNGSVCTSTFAPTSLDTGLQYIQQRFVL